MPNHHRRSGDADPLYRAHTGTEHFTRPDPMGIASRIRPVDRATRERIASGLSRRVHGVFASTKNGCSIPWSSRTQRDLMSLLETDANVLEYQAAPEQVEFVHNNTDCLHVPAFRVRTQRGSAIIDVRPPDTAARAAIFPVLASIYAERGIPYRAFSRPQILTEPRFSNARWVLACRAYQPSDSDRLHVVRALSCGPRTLGELAAELPHVPNVAAAVCAMAVDCGVALDLSAAQPEDITASLNAQGEAP
jgi:hypothetical protein